MPLEKQPKIIELGCLVVEKSEIVSEHNWLINPGELITDEITKITGIKNSDLEGKPSFGQTLGEIEDAFFGCDVAVAHNAPFDVTMLKNELARISRTGFPWPEKTVCTVQEYQHMFGHRPKLTDLYEKVIGSKLAQTHRALDDCIALYEILKKDDFFNIFEMMC